MGYVVTLVVVAAAAVAWLFYRGSREVVSEVRVLNPEADKGTALVVYHPGLTDFHEKVTRAFADGLVSRGWRVEVTTASSQAPSDISVYDLLVLGGPTYFWTPNRPIRGYLRRLGDLGGKRTVSIITAMGMGGRSTSIMEQLVQKANGDLVKALLLYTIRPNEDLYGINDAVEIVTQVAKEIPLPGKQKQPLSRNRS